VPTKNVNLTDHYVEFLDTLVESDKSKNASEVVRAGLRRLEQRTKEEEEKTHAFAESRRSWV
jgi:antitoxin ParD1/3/4